MFNYQKQYSRINPDVLDKCGRIQKAKKIQCILDDYRMNNPLGGIILDVGCSGGIMLSHLTIPDSRKIGMDIDIDALIIARNNNENKKIDLICADGMHLPFRENTIGFTICNHVYEHLPDSEKLFTEIFRTLKPRGVCYCAAGNALMIIEGHYHLPFLSWLPKQFAHIYLRITHRGNYYYEKHLNWWQLRRRVQRFVIHDYTLRIIREPEAFCSADMIHPKGLFNRIPLRVLQILYPMIPTYILMLEKPNSE